MLYYLIYMSRATKPMSDTELDELLSVAVKNNKSLNVSGMLLYLNEENSLYPHGRFIQVLEGDENVIKGLYKKISGDDRHFNIVELFSFPLRQRNFPDWSMGFKRLEGDEVPSDIKSWFDPDSFPEPMNKDSVNIPLTYLTSFYDMNRSK